MNVFTDIKPESYQCLIYKERLISDDVEGSVYLNVNTMVEKEFNENIKHIWRLTTVTSVDHVKESLLNVD